MNAPPPPVARARTGSLLLVATVPAIGLVLAGAGCWWLAQRVDALAAAQQRQDTTLQQLLGEVTRLRIEQTTGMQGPEALLERLRVYAPLVADSRTTEPDYQNARKEMAAVQRAFAALGKPAWQPIQDRIAKLKPTANAEEIKQLLLAAMTIDPDAGAQQLKEVLLGRTLPSPQLRWFAASTLNERQPALAQATLRQVLLTESNRGFNPDWAAAFPGAAVPDRAALSNHGFFNFVVHYVRSGDPQAEDTLLQVIQRVEHDRTTVQECVKALGEMRSVRAVPVIEKLYTDPPQQTQDPLFQSHCLQALVDIQGSGAKPFLEKALPNASSDTVARKIQALLAQIANGTLREPQRDANAKDDQRGK
jgi:hypothetical protein